MYFKGGHFISLRQCDRRDTLESRRKSFHLTTQVSIMRKPLIKDLVYSIFNVTSFLSKQLKKKLYTPFAKSIIVNFISNLLILHSQFINNILKSKVRKISFDQSHVKSHWCFSHRLQETSNH